MPRGGYNGYVEAAGRLRVASELVWRGGEVALLDPDRGRDLVLFRVDGSLVSVQVKTAFPGQDGKFSGTWANPQPAVSAAPEWPRSSTGKTAYRTSKADYYVWVFPGGDAAWRFWVASAGDVKGAEAKAILELPDDWENRWWLVLGFNAESGRKFLAALGVA